MGQQLTAMPFNTYSTSAQPYGYGYPSYKYANEAREVWTTYATEARDAWMKQHQQAVEQAQARQQTMMEFDKKMCVEMEAAAKRRQADFMAAREACMADVAAGQ